VKVDALVGVVAIFSDSGDGTSAECYVNQRDTVNYHPGKSETLVGRGSRIGCRS
jgi:hypothetical protein